MKQSITVFLAMLVAVGMLATFAGPVAAQEQVDVDNTDNVDVDKTDDIDVNDIIDEMDDVDFDVDDGNDVNVDVGDLSVAGMAS
jgi:predicted porin